MLPELTVIETVPCPAVIVQPDGTVHLYATEPLTGDIEYVRPDFPEQTDVEPVIEPGAEGTPNIFTAWQVAELELQEFDAVTQILPPAVPAVAYSEVLP